MVSEVLLVFHWQLHGIKQFNISMYHCEYEYVALYIVNSIKKDCFLTTSLPSCSPISQVVIRRYYMLQPGGTWLPQCPGISNTPTGLRQNLVYICLPIHRSHMPKQWKRPVIVNFTFHHVKREWLKLTFAASSFCLRCSSFRFFFSSISCLSWRSRLSSTSACTINTTRYHDNKRSSRLSVSKCWITE